MREYANFCIELKDSGDYKKIIGEGTRDYANYKKISREMWLAACDASRKQASMIVNCCTKCNYTVFMNYLTQGNIYSAQKERFARESGCIAILNSVPLFLLEYFRKEFWLEVVGEEA